MGEAPAFGNREDFFQYFQNTWLDGNFPIRMWNVYSMEGPRTNNNTEGWHSKLRKLAGKAHSNIYEAVTLFKSEQAATEVSCSWLQADCQPGGGGNADFMRKDWQQSRDQFMLVCNWFTSLAAIAVYTSCCVLRSFIVISECARKRYPAAKKDAISCAREF